MDDLALLLRRSSSATAALWRSSAWLPAVTIVAASEVFFQLLLKIMPLTMFFDIGWAVCWPSSAIASALLLVNRRKRWPWILAGFLLSQVHAEHMEPISQIMVDTACDVSEALMVALVLPPFLNLDDWMKQPRLLLKFILFPVLLGPALTALTVALYHHLTLHEHFWLFAIRWGFADALGMVLWLPLVLVLLSRETYQLFRWKALPRTASLLALVCLAGGEVFFVKPYPLSFVAMPFLLLISLTLGFSGSVLAVNLLTTLVTAATLHGHGPFMTIPDQYEDYRIVVLQVFLTVSMLMCFPVNIVLLERDTLAQGLREAYHRMEQLATLDGLTGLANRRSFDGALRDEWQRSLREGKAVALLMLDVDCFKLYNDRYGHLAGDECLRSVAAVIGGAPRRGGDLAARYGGEEFAVLLPGIEIPGAIVVAEAIRHEIAAMGLAHEMNPHQVVTVSIGCGVMKAEFGVTPQSLIESADQALYTAKHSGRNRVTAASEPVAAEPMVLAH